MQRSAAHDELDGLRTRLAPVLAAVPEIAAAYLFGSVARGEARPDSDLDVGIVYHRPSRDLHDRIAPGLAAAIGKAAGYELVDVVDLDAQGPIFAHEVLCDGARLYEGDRARRVDFEGTTLTRALDFRPTYELATRGKVAALRRWLRERYDLRTDPVARGEPEGLASRPMVTPGRPRHRHTYAQYVAMENESPIKHEFFDGDIFALARGTADHSALAANVLAALVGAVGNRPCRVHTSDLRIYVEAVGLATFPDGVVICGPLQQHPPSPEATAVNPTVLLEVTSDSSEEYDTGGKLEAYRTIPTLREAILVSHRERRITIHRRDAGHAWSLRVAITGGRVTVESLGAELVVDAIYRGSSVPA